CAKNRRHDTAAALFDCVAALAAHELHAPMAFVSFGDSTRQSFVGRFRWPLDILEGDDIIGLDALRSGEALDTTDTHLVPAQRDARFVAAETHVRAYCVAPIRPRSPSGHPVGLIGIADPAPRAALGPEEMRTLVDLA